MVREQQRRHFIPLHPYEKIAQMIWEIQKINESHLYQKSTGV